MNENPIDKLLSRLDGIRRVGNDRFAALCPAHPDKSPSLSIRVADDGRVLVHCFTGCSTADVLASIGLELKDLFIPDPNRRTPARRRPRPSAAQRAARDHARMVLTVAAADLERGIDHGPADRAAIAQAIGILTGQAQEAPRV